MHYICQNIFPYIKSHSWDFSFVTWSCKSRAFRAIEFSQHFVKIILKFDVRNSESRSGGRKYCAKSSGSFLEIQSVFYEIASYTAFLPLLPQYTHIYIQSARTPTSYRTTWIVSIYIQSLSRILSLPHLSFVGENSALLLTTRRRR